MGSTSYPAIDDALGESLWDVLEELHAAGVGDAPPGAEGDEIVPASQDQAARWVIEASADDLSSLLDGLPEGTLLFGERVGA